MTGRSIPVRTSRTRQNRIVRPSTMDTRPSPVRNISPEHRDAEKKPLLYVFVGIALLGVIGLWSINLPRTLKTTNNDTFLSSIAQQIKGVFTNASADFEQIKKDAQSIGQDDVTKLEKRVFPDMPNLTE